MAAAALLTLGSACGGSDGGDENAEQATPATTTTETKPDLPPPATTAEEEEEAEESTRCEKVPRGLVKAIETGLLAGVGGLAKLTDARAVKSEDFKRVYFVSAEIDGAGLEGTGEIGTWAKSGPLRVGQGLILSVDSFANEFSYWDDGGETDAQLSMDNDGAEESKDCVEDAS
jgi:hypothetical protein